jgi:hypothetical protein
MKVMGLARLRSASGNDPLRHKSKDAAWDANFLTSLGGELILHSILLTRNGCAK